MVDEKVACSVVTKVYFAAACWAEQKVGDSADW
jgi:hypothetical protein